MSFFLLLLLALLPVILQWILSLIKSGKKMTKFQAKHFRRKMAEASKELDQCQAASDNGELNNRDRQDFKRALDIYNQIKARSGEAGCQI